MTAPTMDTITPVLDRFIAAYGEPYGADLGVMLETWTEALKGTDVDDVAFVGADWRRRYDHWPRPSQIRELALHRRVVRQREERPKGPDQRCPQCKRVPFIAGFDGPEGPTGRVRCGCPQASERWATPAALAFEAADVVTPRDYRPDVWDRIPGRKRD
jgi:hypothetical protein